MPRYNIAMFWKNKHQPESVRKKNSQSVKQAYQSGKHKKVWEGKHFTKEHKEKIRQSNKKAWKSISLRIEHIKISKKRWRNKAERKRQSKKLKKIWKNPLLRKKMSLKLKLYMKNPAVRKERSRIAKQIWKDKPYLKEKCRKGLLVYIQTNPEFAMRLATLGKKSSTHHLKTKLGYLVMSNGEKKIANFLFDKGIKAEYEKDILFFPESWCNPDFFLLNFNIFIEFYGGHYKAWKKKVLKNILYKKYKIPVIAITPAELGNLDYYLIKEIDKIRKNKENKGYKDFNRNYWTNPLNPTRLKFLRKKFKKDRTFETKRKKS